MDKIRIGFIFDTVDEAQVFLDLVKNAQTNSTTPRDVPSGDSGLDLATPKQKALMDKHGIKYDSFTTKADATERIGKYFDTKRK